MTRELESTIARLLTAGTYAAVGLLAVGTALLLLGGQSPLEGGPALSPGALVGDVAALRPAGFLWLGLLGVVATPSARVVAALAGYASQGERRMATVAVLILGIIALSIVIGIGSEG
jgi:uncharacterized membrane protein